MGDNLPAIDLGTGAKAVAIDAATYHSCALLSDGRVKCWGWSEYGTLGLGDPLPRGDAPNEMGDNLPAIDLGAGAKAVAIATALHHTCALLSDGRVKCWGFNKFGQLGLGDTLSRGDAPNEMGDNLPAVNLGTGAKAVAIATGREFTCALLEDGRVKCWGANPEGQLGLGDKVHRGGDPSQMGDNLPAIDLGTGAKATAIAPSYAHTCALLSDGTAKCWGANVDGLLGLGDAEYRGDGPNEMGDNLPAVNLGTGKTAVAISPAIYHTCALLSDGTIKCWGRNMFGSLGLGDTLPRGDKPDEMGDNLPALKL
jgi:alpha-tubulin suppressor-like RCC1 family protein